MKRSGRSARAEVFIRTWLMRSDSMEYCVERRKGPTGRKRMNDRRGRGVEAKRYLDEHEGDLSGVEGIEGARGQHGS